MKSPNHFFHASIIPAFQFSCLLVFLCSTAHAQMFGSSGKQFWLGFMANYQPPTMTVYISSKTATSGTVSIPLQAWSQNFTVPANSTVAVQLPASAEMTASETIGTGGVRVIANDSVSVFALNYMAYSSDATLALPDPALGRDFYVMAYKDYFGAPYSAESELLIVAAYNNTLIEITPKVVTAGGKPAGVPFQVTLNAGETYLIQASGDLTGTHIVGIDNGNGCNNFAVFAGNVCTGVECPYCDNLYEENFPVAAWGKEFITIPYLTRASDRFHILASQNGTQVSINGGAPINLNAGQFYDFSTGTASYISSNNPISVAQYSKGNDCDNAGADPFYIMLSPVNQQLKNITFNAFTSSVITKYYINIFSECDDVSSVTLDASNISSSFTPVPSNTTYCFARLNITQGNHTLLSDSGIIAYIYGYGNYESYGYAAGANTDRKLANFNIYINNQIYTTDTIPICPGDSISFKGFSDDSTIISWEWDLGDSTFATGDSVIHVYDSLKTYLVKMIVQRMNDCSKDTIAKIFSVKGPFVNATPDTNMCKGQVLSLTVTAWASQYIWSTGDTTMNIMVSPDSSTYYTVRGITPCPGQADTVYVTVREPIADFDATTVCPGSTTNFADQSTALNDSISGWSWDYDDGTPFGNVQNPSHFYSDATGIYYPILTVTSVNGCTDTIIRPVVFDPKPAASFAQNNICFTDTAYFSDNSTVQTGNVTGWTWDFGDGTPTSSLQNPSHLFTVVGNYNVILIVVSDSGCSDTVQNIVPVYPLPVADFTAANECTYDSAKFTDLSAVSGGVISIWSWSFGDAGTSSVRNPSHIYGNPGTYTVALGIVTDKNCMSLKVDTIIINPVPVSNFNYISVCEYDTLLLNDSSTILSGNIISWSWDFGDAGTSTAQNPLHFYGTYGTYLSKLKIISDSGCVDSVTKPVIIYPRPAASFLTQNVCDYDTAVFFDNSTIPNGSDVAWSWNFGDGSPVVYGAYIAHYYNPYGTYTVQLVTTSNNNCVDTVTAPIIIHPSPAADFSTNNVCLYNNALFSNLSAIPAGNIPVSLWKFGDASPPASGWNQIHKYNAYGTYNVTLFIASDSGCVDSVTKPVVIHPLPVAAFTVNNECAYDSAHFTNSSAVTQGAVSGYTWNFGDASTSILANPTHLYAAPNTYTVTLIAKTDSGCYDTTSNPVTIYPVPAANFNFNNICVYDTAQFIDVTTILSGFINQWKWDFGDGFPVNLSPNPYHKFNTPGTYDITFISFSNFSCSDTITKQIIIHPQPVAEFTYDSVCLNYITTFIDQSTVSSGQIAIYQWDFGDATGSSLQNPTHLYSSPQTFTVLLTVRSDSNCTAAIQHDIIVYPLPVADFTFDTICEQQAGNFFDLTSGLIEKYQWDFGDGTGTSILKNPQYIYADDGIYNVSLIATNVYGCLDTMLKQVPVYALPDIQFVSDISEGCVPLTVNFTDASQVNGGSVVWVFWDFGDNGNSTGFTPQHTYNASGAYDITISSSSDMGCTTTRIFDDTIKVYDNPFADFDAKPQPTTILTSQITFTDLSSPVVKWLWNFGDNNFDSIQQNPKHAYEDTGTYSVELIVITGQGCRDTAWKDVIIEPEFIFFIPNAFSPNGKGEAENEIFTGKGIGIKDYWMYIYDRWGDQVFFTDDINKGWNGKVNNGKRPAQQDVYVYYVYIKDAKNVEHEYFGHVTLVK